MGWAQLIFGPKLDGQGRIGRSPDETANVILILTLQYNRENKVSVDEMKGIVTNVATHRGDIEKMVEKIIEVGWLLMISVIFMLLLIFDMSGSHVIIIIVALVAHVQ